MTGRTATAVMHQFEVPDRDAAESLTDALAGYGFGLVTAFPSIDCWVVVAHDEGPYPVDELGDRTVEAVGRAAAEVARRYGGNLLGGMRCDADWLEHGPGPGPIVRHNPGARPPVPEVVVVPTPPPASLALSPDHVQDVPIDLSGLDAVPWAELRHAHGSAEDVPELIRALADPYGDWDTVLDKLVGDNLLHQGDCYSATAPALPFVVRLIASGALPASRRLDLYVLLLVAADRWTNWKLAAAKRSWTVVPGELLTSQVHQVVGEQSPVLLDRWEVEPPALRYLLACLAAHYPAAGRRILPRITAMAERHSGTLHGTYLRLASALVGEDDDRALEVAREVVSWGDLDPGWLDVPGLDPTVGCRHVLTEGALLSLTGLR